MVSGTKWGLIKLVERAKIVENGVCATAFRSLGGRGGDLEGVWLIESSKT